jgi:hypothetical protein
MIRLIDLLAVVIAVLLGVLLVGLGGLLGITGPELTAFANIIPRWLGIAIILAICAILVTIAVYIWRAALTKLGFD